MGLLSADFGRTARPPLNLCYDNGSVCRKYRRLQSQQLALLLFCSKRSAPGNCFAFRRHGESQSLSKFVNANYAQNLSPSQLEDARLIYSAVPAAGHEMGAHPECSSRLSAILDALQKFELNSTCRGKEVLEIKAFKTISMDDLTAIHHGAYVKGLENAMEEAAQNGIILLEASAPTYATVFTLSESLLAAGAGLAVVDSVVAASKLGSNTPAGFSLVRPPGHHALPTGPMGFCIFGNIAIAARYVQRVHGLKRVFIIDFDVHHGNGTNDIFYEDPDVYFISIHQEHSYPGTGKMEELGIGAGEGTTLNLPLPGGAGDKSMLTVYDEVIVPAAQKFKPDIILVSAGYDAHVFEEFPAQFTTNTYYKLASSIKELAKSLCGGLCVFFLEGGYNLKSLSYSVADTFRALLGETSIASEIDNPDFLYEEPFDSVNKAIAEIKAIHGL